MYGVTCVILCQRVGLAGAVTTGERPVAGGGLLHVYEYVCACLSAGVLMKTTSRNIVITTPPMSMPTTDVLGMG